MAEQHEVDASLVRRFQAGDERAFGGIVDRWDQPIFELAMHILGHADDAEEIRQLAFLRVYRGLSAFQGDSRFSTWVYRIVVNLCRDALRSRASAERRNRAVGMGGTLRLVTLASGENASGEDVAAALAELNTDVRAVIVLRHYHDLPFVEIARVMGLPATTVRSRAQAGLRQLAERLGHLAPVLPVRNREGYRGMQ
jgi:RNA polymerase sigma-70 factor (ECF subfamily)